MKKTNPSASSVQMRAQTKETDRRVNSTSTNVGHKRSCSENASSSRKKGKFEGFGVYHNLQTSLTLEKVSLY